MKEKSINLKNDKGITLIALTVMIIILIVITCTVMYNTKNQNTMKNINNMYNDIEILNEKISDYYLNHGELPVICNYLEQEQLQEIIANNSGAKGASINSSLNENDSNDYYVIDIEKLDGITLNYGYNNEDYERVKENRTITYKGSGTATEDEIYIINGTTHQIYYPHGVFDNYIMYYTYNESQLVVSEESDSCATIGKVRYKTLQEAINTIPTDNTETTIILLKDIAENITISKNQKIILDLNGHKISNDGNNTIITVNGILSINGNGTIESTANSKYAIINNDTLTINELKINTSYGGIKSTGKIYINSGAQIINDGQTLEDTLNIQSGTVIINGGIIKSIKNNAIYIGTGTVTIRDSAEIYSSSEDNETIISNGTLIIEGGKIVSEKYQAIFNGATLKIQGSSVEVYSETGTYVAIANNSGATATISAGKIVGKGNSAINNQGTLNISQAANIISYAQTYAAINNSTAGAKLDITGGKIHSESNSAIKNSGTATISGDLTEITSNSIIAATLTNNSGGKMTISAGAVSSENYNTISNLSGGTLTISGTAKIISKVRKAHTIETAGTLNVTGGIISETSGRGYAIYKTGGAVSITGGIIEGKKYNC